VMVEDVGQSVAQYLAELRFPGGRRGENIQ
jgi:hypothetical protein